MERTIELDGQVIPYTIVYKNMKSMIIKVEKGRIVVSSSYAFTIPEIENMIIKNKDKLEQRMQAYTPYLSVEEGYVILYGKKYPIRINDLARHRCEVYQGTFYIYSKQVEKAFHAYAKKELLNYIYDKIKIYLDTYFDHQMPQIVIKKYKGRWGSCYYLDNKVSFNISLIHLDRELIDYVIMHELCHFIEANHSPRFYHELALRMPDYQRRQNILKGKNV